MDASKTYEQTMNTLTLLVAQHPCPEGEPSIRNFCRSYGIGRRNLTASLALKPGHDMSVGVFLRVLSVLGKLALPPSAKELESPISLRQYWEINNTLLTGAMFSVVTS